MREMLMRLNLRFVCKVSIACLLSILAVVNFIDSYSGPNSAISLLVLAYATGSIPFGYVFARLFAGEDIRKIGSGNIGATNVLRTGQKGLAALTLLCDAAKGTAAILLLGSMNNDFPVAHWFPYAIGAAAVLGHVLPLWLDFNGGKGVATILGVLVALNWPTAVFAVGTWLLVALVFRYSSLAALVASVLTPIFAYFTAGVPLMALTIFFTLIIFVRHKDNIKRLLQGKESKIGNSSSK